MPLLKGAIAFDDIYKKSRADTNYIERGGLIVAKECTGCMPQSEIDELNKPIDTPPTDTEILGQQMTEGEIEAMVQGQQVTDIEIRLLGWELGHNV